MDASSQKPKYLPPQIWIPVLASALSLATVFVLWGLDREAPYQSPSTSQSETANWKTYRNEEYGFEFQYPGEWESPTTRSDDYNNSFWIHLGCPEIKMGGEGQCPLQVVAMPASSPEKFISQEFSPDSDLNGKRGEISYKEINNIKTAGFTNFSDYPGDTKYLTFLGSDTYVTFSDYLLSYQQDGIYYQILFTFKFVEPTFDTSDWKTYRNDEFGFEVKYPKSWFIQNDNEIKKKIETGGYISMHISVEPSANTTIEKAIEQRQKPPFHYSYGNREQIVLNGRQFLMAELVAWGMFGANEYFSISGGKLIDAIVEGTDLNDPEINQILSTFKFTK